ncbi:MAG TPA: hypothetical protein ENK57_12730 [Polyangiaceae bacterium]|nr:hypothetical protein [Polyangiaceae bacterium]
MDRGPEARTLEAQTLDAGRWVLTGGYDETATTPIAPFEAVELAIGRLFLPKVGPKGELGESGEA